MREIKFRAWHKQLKKMFSAEEMAADQLTMLPTGKFINVHTIPALSRVNYDMVPLQFTGLKDGNGVEIFEGDIVQYETKFGTATGRVSWQDFRACWAVGKEYTNSDLWKHCRNGAACEVIGNIFEHPSLLTPSPVTEGK
jgi:uncharacterized phage protein (TIGR01671 family)